MESATKTCPNCNMTVASEFCSSCGQRWTAGRITLSEILHDFFANALALESPIVRTMRDLTISPGRMVREFIAGKRKRYYKPLQYFIVVMALYLLIRTVLGFNPIENQFRMMGREPSAEMLATPQIQASLFMAKNINLLMFVFVAVFAFFSRWWFRASGFNYAENLAFGFYTTSQYILFSTFVVPLTFLNPRLFYLSYIIILGYLTFAVASFHRTRRFIDIFKGGVMIVVSWLLYVAIVYFGSFYYIVLTA